MTIHFRSRTIFVASSFFQIEITAACAGPQRSGSSELQAWKVAVAAVIIGAEYFRQLRAAKGRKVFDIWTGNDIHAEFIWMEQYLMRLGLQRINQKK